MQSNKTVIRMGASQWGVTIPTKTGPLTFDFREMSKDERRVFHREFMNAYRKVNPLHVSTRRSS